METGSHVKELFSQTMIYGIGIMLNKAVGFILLPLYTKYFSPEQLGLFALVMSISMILGVIYMFGLETSFMKYFIDAKSNDAKAEIYSSTLFTLTITSFILSLLIFFNAGQIASIFKFSEPEESIFLIKLLSLYMFVDTIYRFPLLLFRAKLDSKTYAYINLLTFVINIICNIIFIVILNKGVESIFYSYIIAVTVTFLSGLVLTGKYLTVNISFQKIKELLVFGNKFIFIGFFILFIDVSDRFFLKYFFDESVVGIYSANYRLASVMSFLIASFKFSWTPYFLNLSSNPENKKVISSIFLNFVFTGLLLFLIFSIFTGELVSISFFGIEFLDIKYREGLNIIPVILLAYFFSGAFSTLNAAPFFTENTRSILYISLFGVIINIVFNFILIPTFGMTGAALSTLITFVAMFAAIYLYSQKIYRIDYDLGRILKLAILTALFFVTGYFVINKSDLDVIVKLGLDTGLIIFYLIIINSLKIIDLKKILMLRG